MYARSFPGWAMGFVLAFAGPLFAQSPNPPPTSSDDDEGGLSVRDTSAGYIDNALPLNQVFLRSDSGFQFTRPNRAEFFYAQPQPNGPGLPQPERSVDYSDLTTALEKIVSPRASVFVGLPVRFLNPDINSNATGLGDIWAGLKYVAWRNEATIATVQLTAYAPSGNAHLGLGTRHVSLEPALLGAHAASDRLTFLGEFRAWTPVGGTDFAGEVLRYGFGGRYNLFTTPTCCVAPIVEFVGWEVLGGKQAGLNEVGNVIVQDAAGTSILNLKLGCRFDWSDTAGLYVGYGRALTGETWYSDLVRVEARWLY